MAIISREISFGVIGTDDTSRVEFAYDTDQPFHVSMTPLGTDASNQWVFARDVLARRVPGCGDVECELDGIWTLLHLRSPYGSATLRFIRAGIDAFLGATERAVPYGAEVLDFDAELYQLLKRGVR